MDNKCKLMAVAGIFLLVFSKLYAASSHCLQQLETRVQWRQLDLENCQLTNNDMQEVGFFLKNHPDIYYVNLSLNAISATGIQSLSVLVPKLEGIDLSGIPISVEEVNALARFKLKFLMLNHCEIDDALLKMLLTAIPTIRYLYLENNQLSAKSIALLTSMPLEVLDLKSNHLTKKSLAMLANSPPRSWLNLSDNDIGPESIPMLAKAKVDGLSLANNPIGDEGFKLLARYLTSYTRALDVGYCGITIEGLKSFSKFRVSDFVLDGNPIGDEGVDIIAEHLATQHSFSLSLAKCNLTAEGMITLSELDISDVNVSENHIGDEGVKALLDMPHLCRITANNVGMTDESLVLLASLPCQQYGFNDFILSLRNNQLTDAGANAFSSVINNQLSYLDIRENQLTQVGIIALRNNTRIDVIKADL